MAMNCQFGWQTAGVEVFSLRNFIEDISEMASSSNDC